MTLVLGILAVGIAAFCVAGLYNYLSDAPTIDEEAADDIGNETPEERTATISKHQQMIEKEKERERRDGYSEQ
jgi:hypothetical protein